MRRSDREICDFQEIVEIMKKCDVCRLALHGDEYPYILPLNFGMRITGVNQIQLYFHGANSGTKYELIAKDNRVSFEMDTSHCLITNEETGNCTMSYESVIGQGRIEIVPEEEKYDALCCLMEHYRLEDFPFNTKVIPQTTVMRLTVEHITAKRRKRR
ncbi:MAG: pyridoxamine 5'-phosphate oxidase family protein [Clostridiales bacterium]|nr:pyridoxamine 5'-phosphate oxidase family protein [Clostridiales bacterium]